MSEKRRQMQRGLGSAPRTAGSFTVLGGDFNSIPPGEGRFNAEFAKVTYQDVAFGKTIQDMLHDNTEL